MGQRPGAPRASEPLFELGLDLPAPGSRDASRRLYQQLREAIIDGRLPPGARLPATRRSEAFLGVSRNTAAAVYERLASERLVVSRPGSGVIVASRAPAERQPAQPVLLRPAARLNPIWLRSDVAGAIGFWQEAPGDARRASGYVDFRPALVDSRLFPFAVFRRLSARQLRLLERRPAAFRSPQGNQGNYRLREAITRHIAVTRAVVCGAEDILVTSGAQQAFDVLARTLVTSGRTVVALEDPGYPPLRAAFLAAGARVVPVRVDADGIIVDAIPADANVICVCPSHQFPLGAALSPARRRDLISLARKRGALIIEDDYDGEFRFEGGALEALRTADAAELVFYVGTFSKCMLPALRLGYIAAPDWAMPTLVAAKNCMDWHSPVPIQASVAAFIAEGHLTRHVRKMREIYKRRRNLLIEALAGELGEWLEPVPSFYGMHVAAIAKAGVDAQAAAGSALAAGVRIHTLARYFLGEPDRSGMVFGYGAADLPQIAHGVRKLREAFRGAVEAPRRAQRRG
ncbi:MAG TPA: PLP-dependent aminotransferase family protein [Steroidobacteraceae bacterium]|nr:PLP-dependent aminotransferase family protein [Steroidobacteraceae bacterium]